MRILIVNYCMDEDSTVLAWQASVVKELARHCEKVVVLTEQLGRFSPPVNVMVHLISPRPWGLPKVLGSRMLMNLTVSKIIRDHKIDACFIHMSMEWTYRLFPALKLHRVPILLWYAHGTVSNYLRLAHACATRVVTSTPEGFRLRSKKKVVIGQGINTELFQIPEYETERTDILYVGRISPRKKVHLFIDVMELLHELLPDVGFRLRIIGPTLSKVDREYERNIIKKIEEKNLTEKIHFLGDMPQQKIPLYYSSAFLHLNLSDTGSMDKTVIEALSCGCPVLTSNEAFYDFLSDFPEFLVQSDDPEKIASAIIKIWKNIGAYPANILRELIISHHDVQNYAVKIYQNLKDVQNP